MGIHKSGAAWEVALRGKVQKLNPRLRILKAKSGKTQVRFTVAPGDVASATLKIDWDLLSDSSIWETVQRLDSLMKDGMPLKTAAAAAQAGATGSGTEACGTDWLSGSRAFEKQLEVGGVSTTTWNQQYRAPIRTVVEIMTSEHPALSSDELMGRVLAEHDWERNTPRAFTASNAINRFSDFMAREQGAGPSFNRLSPTGLEKHRGKRREAQGNKSSTLEDTEILWFLEKHQDNPYMESLRVMAVYGLRPEELRHLSVKTQGGESFLWCSYEKKSGPGDATKPRGVEPCLLRDADGDVVDWKLLARLKSGDLGLPHFPSAGSVADRINGMLRGSAPWLSLLEAKQKEDPNANLTAYCFRHSYSLRAHHRGIGVEDAAASMGHSPITHVKAYPWCSQRKVTSAFAKANG